MRSVRVATQNALCAVLRKRGAFYFLNSGRLFSKNAVMPHLVFNPAPDQVDPANLKAAFLMI
jgi:hypothetical protein